ncbi:hypothetical protein FD755_024357 [Muntiacus reevesi]|uniref:TSC22 domain family protein 3 n=1 Tax=Muntiacus reevesi TaxID=9886 RepID=A0A5N3VA37_MUNRE|nr:hypothetical protein FD755_024357 [Muntiacus reevesi]
MAQPKSDCRSPVGLDCCNCCLDLAHRSGLQRDNGGDNNNSGSPTVSNFRQLQEKLVFENLNTDKLNSIMRQDSLEPVLRDPCYLINEGICNRNIDQTMLSILLFFHRWNGGKQIVPTDSGGCHGKLVLECRSDFLEILLKGKEGRVEEKNTMGRPKVAAVFQTTSLSAQPRLASTIPEVPAGYKQGC